MSGGVDSSVVAWRLKQQGHDVHGLFMRNWLDESSPGGCTSERDWTLVKKVGEKLGIPVTRLNFEHDYWQRVFEPTLEHYRRGWTPNPDVLCNREVKFGALFEHLSHVMADSKRAWWVATGHYARTCIARDTNETCLLRPTDAKKDQTLFLCNIPYQALQRTIFPLWQHTKEQVKREAMLHGLEESATRPESMGLCFVSPRNIRGHFRNFLAEYLEPSSDPLRVMFRGVCVGVYPRDKGIWSFTVGEKCGLSLAALQRVSQLPWYVWKKDVATNAVHVCPGYRHPLLFSRAATCSEWGWASPWCKRAFEGADDVACTVRIRHQQQPVPAHFRSRPDCIRLQFHQPQRGIAPGQHVAVYVDNLCVGGGPIVSHTLAHVASSLH
ncbi:tRNA(5-methylaminomethyl-2-thiouridylate)-methyltransferase [Schizosaccharomyces japonicus yFS275]|uniref:tRNA-5-taurinomethyluridine 2-sulfurtransferase n=1 Tax=Schizosaccharomyces japonicus (strain yFS275 / FY16936) TaxID=402676 RepID=B6JVF0_SCHJY|nr:tRNA(5-methylaminomethyl-2-thiouridylate)-methyltransferase [Schizosaccharomyces japonicus yFS275]EEB05351.2 tRNA(5-methylaminomethyl-2-thiouridylate)-methyltransferase [Schizosaccharomyces japonicus yFS275]